MTSVTRPFACVACRRSFKRTASAEGPGQRACPTCGEPAVALSRKFKVPARDDDEQWQKVRLLVQHGFRFEPVYEPVRGEKGSYRQVKYPGRLREVDAWLKRYGHLARGDRAREPRK